MGSLSVTILHYNDVYNIESRVMEPVGGAARFCAAIKSYSHLNPLVLFSGDAFSPSMCEYYGTKETLLERAVCTKYTD
jgi:5'-nucleotidase